MRKILAILLAMLMLLGSAALAEDAAVLTLDNLSATNNGQTASIQDLGISLVLENVNNLPSVALLIDGGTEPLVTAVAQLTSKQFNFAIDGMGYGYTADIPQELAAQLAQVGDEGMAMLVPLIAPAFDQLAMPPFTGVEIPKLELAEALSAYMTGVTTFEIPSEQIYALLDQIMEIARTQGSNVKELEEAVEALEQMKASGMGVAIQGEITDQGTTQTVAGGVYLDTNGTVSDQELVHIILTSSANNIQLAISAPSLGISGDAMTASLVSDPAAARLDFNLNVAGTASMAFALYAEGTMQKATLTLSAGTEGGNLAFGYGQQNGSDVVSFGGEFDGQTLSVVIDTAMGADGVRTGTLTCSASQYDNAVSLAGNLTMYVGDAIDLSGFTMPSDLRSLDQLDDDAIGQAFQPVMDYIDTHTTMN